MNFCKTTWHMKYCMKTGQCNISALLDLYNILHNCWSWPKGVAWPWPNIINLMSRSQCKHSQNPFLGHNSLLPGWIWIYTPQKKFCTTCTMLTIPKILQTARKITYVYWYIYLVMTADQNSDKTCIILLFLLLQSRSWDDGGNWTPFAKVTTLKMLLTFR